MECNKDEASYAKLIAEQKLAEMDYAGAKKFALKAEALYPLTEGLLQLKMTIDVYIAAENKVSGGEVDWYGIMGLTPTANVETVRKQYLKLARMIHPDKNKCTGADGAFKLVSDAWSLLSDKVKRYEYDQRRDFCNNITNNRSSSCLNVEPPLKTTVPPQSSSDFWTICVKCETLNMYPRIYLDKTIICAQCRNIFKAVEREFDMAWLRPCGQSRYPDDQSSTNHVPPPGANVFSLADAAPNTGGLGGGENSGNHVPPQSSSDFWTICVKCETLNMYPRIYLDKTIICAQCRNIFKAVEREFDMAWLRPCGQSRYPDDQSSTNHVPPPCANVFNPADAAPNTGGLGGSANSGNHVPPQSSSDLFWTICVTCEIISMYSRIHLDKTIICPNCGHLFKAVESAFDVAWLHPCGQSQYPGDQSSTNHVPPRVTIFAPNTEGLGGDVAAVNATMNATLQKIHDDYERAKRLSEEKAHQGAEAGGGGEVDQDAQAGGGWERRVKVCTRASEST